MGSPRAKPASRQATISAARVGRLAHYRRSLARGGLARGSPKLGAGEAGHQACSIRCSRPPGLLPKQLRERRRLSCGGPTSGAAEAGR